MKLPVALFVLALFVGGFTAADRITSSFSAKEVEHVVESFIGRGGYRPLEADQVECEKADEQVGPNGRWLVACDFLRGGRSVWEAIYTLDDETGRIRQHGGMCTSPQLRDSC